MTIGKRLRFEIMKRDGFRCRYCGATAVREPLEIDHVHPIAEGGSDEPENLVTACFSCNRGKSKVLLEDSHLPSPVPREALLDQAEQIREYSEAVAEVTRAHSELRDHVAEAWRTVVGDDPPETLYRQFPGLLDRYPSDWVLDSMKAVADAGITDALNQTKYFYGCLRKKRGEN